MLAPLPLREKFDRHEQVSKCHGQLTDALIILLHDRLRDHGANIASLGDILLESELHHQLVQDAGGIKHCHVLVDRDLGETVARH